MAKFTGLDRLVRKLAIAVPESARRAARQRLAFYADRIQASMEGFVPQDEGDLLASIGWVWGDEIPAGATAIGSVRADDPTMVITIFAGSEDTIVFNKTGGKFQNALIQEFGTANMPKNPFFLPAYRIHKRAAKNGIRRAIRNSIRQSAR